jgi:O-antigen ligase
MKFKKSTSDEIERTLSILVILILVAIPTFFMLEWFGIMPYYRISSAEVILVMGGMFLTIFLIMYLLKRENRYFTLFDLFIILFAASLLLSTIFAQDVQLAIAGNDFTMEGTLVNISYLLLMFTCSLIQNPKYRKWIYGSLILVGVFEVFMAIMQSVVRSEVFLGDMTVEAGESARAFGSLMNQNTYGALMAMFAGGEFGMFYVADHKKTKMMHAILALGFTYAVVLSGTRGAMVGLACAALTFSIIILIYRKKSGEKMGVSLKKLGIVIGCVVLAVILAMISSYTTVVDTIDRVASDSSAAASEALGSGRIGIWKGAWNNLFLEHPIVGVGISNFMLKKYLDILCSQGIVGLATYMMLMVYVFVTALKRLKKNGVENSNELLGLSIAFTAYMFTAIFGWRIIYLTPYFYVVAGLMSSRNDLKRISFKNRKNK